MAEPFTPAIDAAGALRAYVLAAYEVANEDDHDESPARIFGLDIADFGQDDEGWQTVTLADGRRLRWTVNVEPIPAERVHPDEPDFWTPGTALTYSHRERYGSGACPICGKSGGDRCVVPDRSK